MKDSKLPDADEIGVVLAGDPHIAPDLESCVTDRQEPLSTRYSGKTHPLASFPHPLYDYRIFALPDLRIFR